MIKLKDIPLFIPIVGALIAFLCAINLIKDRSYVRLTEDSNKPGYWISMMIEVISLVILVLFFK